MDATQEINAEINKLNEEVNAMEQEAIQQETIQQETIQQQQIQEAEQQRQQELLNTVVNCSRCNKELRAGESYITSFERDKEGNPVNNYLCGSCKKKLDEKINETTIGFIGLDHFRNAAKELILGIEEMSGKNLQNDQNFIDTPNRVARAWWEIMSGTRDTENKIKQILSTCFESDYDGIICANNITAWGVCPHHLLPVKFIIKKIGYVAGKNKKVLGISKLKRLVDILAAQPILQEDLADKITDALMSFGAEGAAVTISAVHCCMVMRGAKATGANVITSSMKGCFRHNPACRSEFLAITSDRDVDF